MTDNMLEAVAKCVRMVSKCGYYWDEALDYCRITYSLDEFQAEDLEVMARSQYRRLQQQMGV